MAKFVSVVIIGMPLVAVGITVNIVNLVIFIRNHFIPMTTRLLLLINATLDILVLLTFALLLYPYVMCTADCKLLWITRSHAYGGFLAILLRILRQSRNWLIVIVGAERWLLVCHPITYKRCWNKRCVARVLVVSSVINLVTSIPLISSIYFHAQDKERCRVVSVLKGVDAVVTLLFHALLPCATLVFFTIAIVCETTRQHNWQLSLGKIFAIPPTLHLSKRNKLKLHRALMISLLVFVFLTSPLLPNSSVELFMNAAKEPACVMYRVAFVALEIHNLAVVLQASVNFFVYLAFWDRFRRIVCRCRCRVA